MQRLEMKAERKKELTKFSSTTPSLKNQHQKKNFEVFYVYEPAYFLKTN